MKNTVTIETRTVGQSFGTQGLVKRDKQVIYRGKTGPYNFIEAALADARNWAEEHGYEVSEQ